MSFVELRTRRCIEEGGVVQWCLLAQLFSHTSCGFRQTLDALQLLASKTAYYTICTRQEDVFKDNGKRGGNSFLAKLRASSVAHTEYALYDRCAHRTNVSFSNRIALLGQPLPCFLRRLRLVRHGLRITPRSTQKLSSHFSPYTPTQFPEPRSGETTPP